MITRQATFWFSVPLLSLVFPAEALQEFVGVFTERSSVLFPALTESDRCQKEFYVFFSTSGVCFFPPSSQKMTHFSFRGVRNEIILLLFGLNSLICSVQAAEEYTLISAAVRRTRLNWLWRWVFIYLFLFGSCDFHMTYQGWDSNFDMIELHFIYSNVSCVLWREHLDPGRSR